MLRMMVDPNKANIRALPTSLEDLAVAGQHSRIPCFDNLSKITDIISDGLCRMSTGAGFGTRAHYTNYNEAIFESIRPIILNGISYFVSRTDLAERALIVHLPRIAPDKRRTERSIWMSFENLRPKILGALLDAAVIALKNLPTVNLSECPRMADFAHWAEAAAPALEAEPGEMLRLLLEKQDEVLSSKLDDPLLLAVLEFLKTREGIYEGRPSDLLESLKKHAPEVVTKQKNWPKSGLGLSNALARLVPVLRLAGVKYENLGHKRNGSRILLGKA
jgi:hypothetical protein